MRARLHTSFPAAMVQTIPRPSVDCRQGNASGRQAVVVPVGL
jgi:hypothetical protein